MDHVYLKVMVHMQTCMVRETQGGHGEHGGSSAGTPTSSTAVQLQRINRLSGNSPQVPASTAVVEACRQVMAVARRRWTEGRKN